MFRLSVLNTRWADGLKRVTIQLTMRISTFVVLLAAVHGMRLSPASAQALPADEAELNAATLPGEMDEWAPDWSLIETTPGTVADLSARLKRTASNPAAAEASSWSHNIKPDGASAVAVKQSLSPFWNTRVGVDMTVARSPSSLPADQPLPEKFASDPRMSQSSGTAWAAATAPGVGSVWDRTDIEARIDPAQDQSKFSTRISKDVPLGDNATALTLTHGYNVIEQSLAPLPGLGGRAARNYETEQSAKLSLGDTGASLITGQSLSSTDDKWLRKIGAEQKFFGGVSVTGAISETPHGASNKSLSAGFKQSW